MMEIINRLKTCSEKWRKEQLKQLEQSKLRQQRARYIGYYLTQELNGVLSNMPRAGGMTPITSGGGLCPVQMREYKERNTVEYIFRWSKSMDSHFSYSKICDIQTKVIDYLAMYRMRVLENMSSSNSVRLKRKYHFLLSGIRVNLVQEDLYNLYLFIEVRWR